MNRNQCILIVTSCLLVCLAGCTSSPDLNTPREIINDRKEVLGTGMTINVRQDNIPQRMELIQNRFRCEISEAGPVPVVRLRIELQNTQPNGSGTNSIYFRTEALPIDNSLHTLSGDPIGNAPDAVKIIFNESGTLIPLIPSSITGAFRISLRRVEAERRLYGLFTCTTPISTTSRTVELAGDFVITY